MIVMRVGLEELKKIKMGSTAIFTLPGYDAMLTAKTQAYAAGRKYGCRFRIKSDFETNTIAIRREERL